MGMFQEQKAKEVTDAELLQIEGKGVRAFGVDTPDGFLVKKGSKASKQDTPTMADRTRVLRSNLLAMGVLKEEPDAYVFMQDYLFSSSSSASMVVLARYSSGPSNWKNKAGKSLGEIQSA
jgi:hypothetical protein